MKRPNILWISFEDISPRLGCYGDPVATTPHIDRLAREGIRYENAFAVAGVCAPSRASVITGMYPTFIGAHHMRVSHTHPMAPDLPTPYEAVPPPQVRLLPEMLRAQGYYTCNNEKTDYQFASPFTAWDDCSDSAHWRNREENQPFFAVFNNTQTHESNMWPEKGPEPKIGLSSVEVPPYLPDDRGTREALARHYQNIASNDQWAGELLMQLEKDGELENTIIMFWSDHGDGLPRAKRWPYDAGIRVPLIVRLPKGKMAGSVQKELVSLIDLAPTALSLADLPLPRHLQGAPFLGSEAQGRDYVFATRDRCDESYDRVRAARDERFKYIRHYYPNTPYLQWIPYRNRHPAMQELWRRKEAGQLTRQQEPFMGNRPVEELYDTAVDPHELNNLTGMTALSGTLERLRGELDRWEDRFDRFGEIPEREMVGSWWPKGEQPATAAPVALPLANSSLDQTLDQPLQKLAAKGLVQLHCSTQGASIGYRFDAGPWKLYSQPFQIPRGAEKLRAKAIRIGYQESPESTFDC